MSNLNPDVAKVIEIIYCTIVSLIILSCVAYAIYLATRRKGQDDSAAGLALITHPRPKNGTCKISHKQQFNQPKPETATLVTTEGEDNRVSATLENESSSMLQFRSWLESNEYEFTMHCIMDGGIDIFETARSLFEAVVALQQTLSCEKDFEPIFFFFFGKRLDNASREAAWHLVCLYFEANEKGFSSLEELKYVESVTRQVSNKGGTCESLFFLFSICFILSCQNTHDKDVVLEMSRLYIQKIETIPLGFKDFRETLNRLTKKMDLDSN